MERWFSRIPTPWKINMEPTNHPFGKENDPNLHDYGPCQSSRVQPLNSGGKPYKEDEPKLWHRGFFFRWVAQHPQTFVRVAHYVYTSTLQGVPIKPQSMVNWHLLGTI